MVTFGKWSIIKTFYFKSECHILKDKRNAIKRGEEMIKDCATKLRLLAVAFVLAVGHMLVFAPSHAYAFAGGDGTVGNPYQITTPAELASLESYVGSGYDNAHFKVMNNINLDIAPYNTGTGWSPIGQSNYFYGELDGNGKTISGLYVNLPNNNTYYSVPGAILASQTINGHQVLVATYQLEDNDSILDLDPVTHQILDPVGLGTTVVDAPNTGFYKP